MKSYHHYEKKLKRLKDEREKAIQKNPRFIENKSKSDQLLRNERKFETSKSNYLISSQATFASATSVTISIENYANPAIIKLFRQYVNFFKQLTVGLSPLNDLEELLTSLKHKHNLNEQEIKEQKENLNPEIIEPAIDKRNSYENRSSNSNDIYPEIQNNVNFDLLFSSPKKNERKTCVNNDQQTPQPKRDKKINKITATPNIDLIDEFEISKNQSKMSNKNDNYNTLFSFNNPRFDQVNSVNNQNKEEKQNINEDEYNFEDNQDAEVILQRSKISSKEEVKRRVIQDLINKRNEEKKSPKKERVSSIKDIPSQEMNKRVIRSEKKRKSDVQFNEIDLLENPIKDNTLLTLNNNSLQRNLENNQYLTNENSLLPKNSTPNELFNNNLFEEKYLEPEEEKVINKSESKLIDNNIKFGNLSPKKLSTENPNDINAQLLLQTQLMMFQTMNQMNLLKQQKLANSNDPNDPFAEINQISIMANMPQFNQNMNFTNNFQGINENNSNFQQNFITQTLNPGLLPTIDEKKSPNPKSKNPFKKI